MLQARSCFRPAELHCALRQVSGGHVERITSPQCTQLALGKVGRRNLPKTKPATKDLQRPDRLRPPSLEGASLKQKITLLHAGTAIECKPGRLPRGARALVVTNLTDSVVVYVTFSVVHRQRNEFRCVRHRRDARGPSKGDLVEDGNAIQYIVKAYDPLRRKFELERRPERAEIAYIDIRPESIRRNAKADASTTILSKAHARTSLRLKDRARANTFRPRLAKPRRVAPSTTF